MAGTSGPFTQMGLVMARRLPAETAASAYHCLPWTPFAVSVKFLDVVRSAPLYVVRETRFSSGKEPVPVPVPVLLKT